LAVHLVAPNNATGDIPVYVPWDSCKLVYAYTVTTVAEGNQGAVEIDLELDAASGSEIMSITVAQNAAIGDLDEATTYTTEAASENLGRKDTSRDAVNIEITGAASTAWQGMLYMYFER
jgi:hypothetical protein